MADYSEAEARDARRIVESFFELQGELPMMNESLAVADIQADAHEFAGDLDLLKELDANVPAVRIRGKEIVPLALSMVVGKEWPLSPSPKFWRGPRFRGHPFFEEWRYLFFRAIREEGWQAYGVESMSREEAKETFLKRGTDFLATRIAAVREFNRPAQQPTANATFLNVLQRAGGPRVTTPGCQFTVSTNSNGLRVFWSGAYRISPNYFSHPTTPTHSVLQSGTYVFGVDGGAYGGQVQWDLNAIVTLPGNPYLHMNY